ncbi:MAG: hypothetical protein K8I30_09200, partial [Anaerolineae bacterium]|nr:hypothetical protein [Anaerolineae bacterium]
MENRQGLIDKLESGKQSFVSRRDVLKIGAGLLAGAILPDALTGLAHAYAQTGAFKHIYIAADDHTDYYWMTDGATYQNAFINMLDYYLNQIDSTQGNAPEHQMRWNCDGHFWLWVYEKNRTPAQFT